MRKALFIIFISFAPSLFAQNQPDWDARLKKEKIDKNIFYTQIDQKSFDEPIKSWEIVQVIKDDIGESKIPGLIVAFTARSEEGEPEFGGFAFFKKEGEAWALQQFESIDEYMVAISFAGLTGNTPKELVANTGRGNHGSMMDVFRYAENKWINIFHLEGYNAGPQIMSDNGKDTIVDFRNSLIYACEGCQICYEVPYHWNGKDFIPEANEFDELVEEGNKVSGSGGGKQNSLKKSLAHFEGYLKSHPNSFAAAYNCVDLSRELGFKEKEEKYKEMALKIGVQNPECPHWNLSGLSWQQSNLQGRIEELENTN